MPPRALRPCKGPGCRTTTRDSSGYCDVCRPAAEAKQAAVEASLEQRRGSSSKRGYGYAWRDIRERVLRQHGGLCLDCKKEKMFILAVEVHHIDGDSANNDFLNLAPLCRAHHDLRHGVLKGRRKAIRS